MSVSAKHIATFILGAAAGYTLSKYHSMSDEEKDKFIAGLKEKANKFKGEAENAWDKASDYFEELRTKGTDALKEHAANAESILKDLFGNKTSTPETGTK
ncbi:MAG: hypothetical protein JST09_16255 [Bacteroidetes bacterium]|nr:hypothetical protein [Bacteroidota bacterium]MBS1610479.1 hypothetical protein [Bacteroidota bacterium]